jgi:ABC-type amino acid transport substrate-binding protein
LEAKRIDAMIENRPVLTWVLNKQGKPADAFRNAGMIASRDKIYLAISPKSKDVDKKIQLLEDGMQQMRADGRLKAILDRYGMEDIAPAK